MRNSHFAEMTLPEFRWPGISWCAPGSQELPQAQAGDEEKHFLKNTT